MVFYTLILQFYLENGQKKKKMMIPFWGMKAGEKQSSATIMISVDGKGTVFPVKLKLQGDSFD